MAKQGTNINKIVGKKKINHYSKAECEGELKRLDTSFKDKYGLVIPDTSVYRRQIEARLAKLA